MRVGFVVTLLAMLCWASIDAQSPRAFTTSDALDVRSVRVADITEDGRWIAATISTRRGRTDVDHYRFGDPTYISPSLSEVLIIDAENASQYSLFENPEQVQNPTWSPSGNVLAFFRREGEGFRLYLHDVNRRTTRPLDLRTSKELSSSSTLVWSPSGDRILITLRPDGWADESRAAFLRLTQGPIVVQDSRDDFLSWDAVRDLANREIPALVTVRNGTVQELLGEVDMQDPQFSADGSQLFYQVSTRQKTSYTRGEGTEFALYQLTIGDTQPRALIEPRERRITVEWNGGMNAYAFAERGNVFVRTLDADSAVNLTGNYRTPLSATDTTRLSFSIEMWRPDGQGLLLTSQRGWHHYDLGRDTMMVTLTLEEDEDARPRRSVERWTEDGSTIFFSTAERTRWMRGLSRVDVNSGAVTTLFADTDLYRGWEISPDGRRAVFGHSDGNTPDELWTLDLASNNRRQLTDVNPQIAQVALTRTELVEYLDVDGNTLYGILYYPANYQAGTRYPLVAEVYEQFFDNGYNENMNLVTAQGWFGFRPSVEFETGYPGEAWLKAVPNAINKLIERGLVDGEKVGVYGQSYGGYAVNLLIAQTNRFAAAANVSGKVNIISFLGDSPRITTRNYNAAEEGQDRIGATLWEQPHKYIATSAIMVADRIETPLLLLSGEGDWNVPATNQREMYYALRRLGKKVVWVNYINGGHGAGRASSADDFHDHWRRMFEWFAEHFGETETHATSDDGNSDQR